MAQELKAEWQIASRRFAQALAARCGRRAGAPGVADQVHRHRYDDVLLVNMLEAYGIPCLKNYPGDGQFGKIMLGMSGYGVEILVPETLLADAQALREGCASALTEGEDDA